jgi:2-hydroxy-6-oxonona-2,4-dienedioate hydrolase
MVLCVLLDGHIHTHLITELNSHNVRNKKYWNKEWSKHPLFLHGLGSSVDRWTDIPQVLSRYYQSVTIDLIGFVGTA